MNTFKIDESINGIASGVYLISFSSGHFYIGSSQDLWNRVLTHKRSILSDYSTAMTCKSLLPMKGLNADACISLLEPYKIKDRYGRHDLLKLEWSHIESKIGDKKMLNDPRVTGNSTQLGVYIKKSLYNKLKALAASENKALSEFVEHILSEAVKTY